MTQRYCEACGNLFDSTATGGATPAGNYLCPNCATKEAAGKSVPSAGDSAPPDSDMMSKGGGLKNSVDQKTPKKLTFRCPGCNALLSSRPIEKRSRLTCPKCNEKVIINPDGSSELLTKRAPHMKKMNIPQKEKVFSDKDLERLLDFGETQPIGRDAAIPAPKPKPPSARKKPAAPAPAPAAPQGQEDFSGPQYTSDEDEERKKFLDQVQGPGGRKPTSAPKTLDAEIPATGKKVPTGRKKLTKFGTDRRKTESVEDRLEAAKTKRAATRNKILAIAFIVLPLLMGVILFYNTNKAVEEGEEPSGLAMLVKNIGSKARLGALAINKQVLRQTPMEREEEQQEPEAGQTPPDEQPGQPEKPAEEEPEKPVDETPEEPVDETKEPEEPVKKPDEPAEQPEKPTEKPEEPAEETKTPEKPVEKPEEPVEETKTPEKPVSEPVPKKPKAKTIKCPNTGCGRTILKSETTCPWCGQEIPQTPDKGEAPRNN
jgi:DNA-directed RNA polymerase subunit M/transcription elongation factor TFIIS